MGIARLILLIRLVISRDTCMKIIDELNALDLGSLSYVQLRRLYSSLLHRCNDLEEAIASRSGSFNLGETVKQDLTEEQAQRSVQQGSAQ